mmetsp:Transcript_6821/g.859  ORF Transcript_6821/g.859 Transcript_6821/m.859 type:complete len:84 (-) Transcript_6821:512-763(-)
MKLLPVLNKTLTDFEETTERRSEYERRVYEMQRLYDRYGKIEPEWYRKDSMHYLEVDPNEKDTKSIGYAGCYNVYLLVRRKSD